MVAERVAEEMEKRKDEIEAEVLRRVEEAKSLMEQQVIGPGEVTGKVDVQLYLKILNLSSLYSFI